MSSERRPEGVEGYALDTGLFPFDAFGFTRPTASTPVVYLKATWTFSTPSIKVSNMTLHLASHGTVSNGALIAYFT